MQLLPVRMKDRHILHTPEAYRAAATHADVPSNYQLPLS